MKSPTLWSSLSALNNFSAISAFRLKIIFDLDDASFHILNVRLNCCDVCVNRINDFLSR